MRKDVDIIIQQVPVSVNFTCPHCEEDIKIDYERFKKLTGNDLGGLIYDSNTFECPNCNGDLLIDEVALD